LRLNLSIEYLAYCATVNYFWFIYYDVYDQLRHFFSQFPTFVIKQNNLYLSNSCYFYSKQWRWRSSSVLLIAKLFDDHFISYIQFVYDHRCVTLFLISFRYTHIMLLYLFIFQFINFRQEKKNNRLSNGIYSLKKKFSVIQL